MKSLESLWRGYALGVFFLLTLAGCLPLPPPPRLTPHPPFTCDSFTESYWQEFEFGADSSYVVDDVIAKIVELWNLDSSQIRIDAEAEGKYVGVVWQVEFPDEAAPRYVAHFHEESKLSSVFFQWKNRKPTLSQVIGCLGDPDFYAAYYNRDVEFRSFNVDLWYVDKGFVVRGFSFHGQDPSPPEISPDYPMALFTATKPANLERMISTMYGSELLTLLLCPIRPWPVSIEAIEVESYLDRDARCSL